MKTLTHAALSAMIGCGAVSAQGTVYSPAAYADTAGNNLTASPISPTSELNWQQLHDGIPAMTIRRMTFRRSTMDPSRGLTQTMTTEIQLQMSSAPHSSSGASTVFAANHGSDLTTVMSRKRLSFLPAPWIRGVRAQPDAFFQLPFDRAFPFLGGTLCWQAESKKIVPGPLTYLDAFATFGSGTNRQFGSARHPFGTRCNPNTNRTLSLSMSATTTTLTLLARAFATGATAPTAAVLRIGRSETRTRSGIPLPFDLAPLGAPHCKLYTSADLNVPLTQGSVSYIWQAGSPTHTFPYSSVGSQAGLPLFGQTIFLSPTANQLGIETTGAVRSDIPTVTATSFGVQLIVGRVGTSSGTIATGSERGMIVGFSPR